MLRVNWTRSSLFMYKRELGALLLMAITAFFSIALVSYHTQDSSWFYYSSAGTSVSNWCGPAGAHCSALLFHLFGASSFFLLGFLFFTVYMILTRLAFADEWERLLSWFLLTVIGASLSNVHRIDFFGSSYPGGYVGKTIHTSLYTRLDTAGTTIFLYTLLVICFVLLSRCSYIEGVHYLGRAFGFLRRKKHWFVYAYRYSVKACQVAVFPFIWFSKFFKELVYGSLLKDNQYSVREFEGNFNDIDVHVEPTGIDSFWKKFQMYNTNRNLKETSNSSAANTHQSVGQKLVSTLRQVADTKMWGMYHVDSVIDEACSVVETNSSVTNTNPYSLPSSDIFIGVDEEQHDAKIRDELQEQAKILEEKLERFGVCGEVISIKRGPVVTLFEYRPQIDTKVSKILSLEDDLALALRAMSIRIIAPIPGRSVVGFEVANRQRRDVLLSSVVKSHVFQDFAGKLPLILGQNTIGENIIIDLARMPHLLIAGSTGSGKSVALNAMLVSLLCRLKPSELKLLLIDPKRLELAAYADVAHLLFPIVMHPKKATLALKWVVKEMEERYERMASVGARNMTDYNDAIKRGRLKDQEALPFIVVVIDELADLMMTTGKEVEDLIARITQMARAAGIHMIVATQRPSVDVITGLIKVNFPGRISFRVASKVDSRTILDEVGADRLLGRGDMLFLDSVGSIKRVHGAYVSNREIEGVVDHIRSQERVEYLDLSEVVMEPQGDLLETDDQLYQDVVAFLDRVEEVSISLLQRKFRIGYNRSARIIDTLESQGLILPADGSKTRKVIR